MLEAVAALRDAIQAIKSMLTDPEKNLGRLNKEDKVCFFIFILFCFILFSFPTGAGVGAGSPQQRKPITVGPYYLSHPVNSLCGRKPEYPKKTHDFQQSYHILFTLGLVSTSPYLESLR